MISAYISKNMPSDCNVLNTVFVIIVGCQCHWSWSGGTFHGESFVYRWTSVQMAIQWWHVLGVQSTSAQGLHSSKIHPRKKQQQIPSLPIWWKWYCSSAIEIGKSVMKGHSVVVKVVEKLKISVQIFWF